MSIQIGGISMQRVFSLGALLVAVLGLAGCAKTTSPAKATQRQTTVTKSTTQAISLTSYRHLELGATKGGAAEKAVKALFGKPHQTTTTTIPGVKSPATQISWTNVDRSLRGATVTITFLDGRAVGKSYAHAKVGRPISNQNYHAMKVGMSPTSVRKKLGQPTGETVLSYGVPGSQVLTYSDGQAKITFTFGNDALLSKTKTTQS